MTAARWACVVAALGAVLYLLLDPATADHAAQEYRAGLGLGLWDNGWFAGHHTPAYSLLSPALGALVGVRVAGALAAVAAALLFALLAERWWGAAAGRVAAVWFAIGVLAQLVSGRLTFLLGAAFGLAALLALQRARPLIACGLAVLTSVASPVAGLFLALAAIARGFATARHAPSAPPAAARTEPSAPPDPARHEPSATPTAARHAPSATPTAARHAPSAPPAAARHEPFAPGVAAALVVGALAPAAILAGLFPEGGTEPFVASAFWPALVAIALVAVALPARERTLRIGAVVYGLTCIAAFALATPLGGNVTRLGALAAGPVLAGALLAKRARPGGGDATAAAGGRGFARTAANGRGPAATCLRGALAAPALLAVLALPLAYWQLYPAVRDVVRASGDPSTAAAYYAPLLRFLDDRPGTFRLEIPFTANHWEAAHVAPHIPLARGWERQLDRRYGALFYDGTLTAATYRAWLDEHAVAYVAVADVDLDYSARDEAKLIADRPSYLRPVWRSAHWRVFAVQRPVPLVSGAAGSIELAADGFTLGAGRRGTALVRVRHTRWWSVTAGRACVERGPQGLTRVRVLRPGRVRVQARLGGSACRR
jgi:hypothetical protein